MKIAITGHTGEVGSALTLSYITQGHEIVGLTQSTGYPDSDLDKIVDAIKDCDVFVNLYSNNFVQTELLYRVHKEWLGQDKQIVNISSISALGYFGLDADKPVNKHIYKHQKIALEEAHWLLNTKNNLRPRMVLVKIGPGPDTTSWQEVADYIVDCLEKGVDNPYLLELAVAK